MKIYLSLVFSLYLVMLCQLIRADETSELRSRLNQLEEKQSLKLEKIGKDYQSQIEELKRNHKKELSEIHERLRLIENQRNSNDTSLKTKENNSLITDHEELEEEIAFLNAQRVNELIKLNLYTTLEFENFENRNSSFDARNIELILEGKLNDRLTAFAEIEFERTAITSSGNRQGEVEVEQGWLEYRINDFLNPRMGVILVPFGRFNLEHFDVLRDLTDRPIAMRRIIPVTWAEAGAGFTGKLFLGNKFEKSLLEELDIQYQFFFVNGLTNDLTDTSTREARGAFGKDNNGNKALVGRMGIDIRKGVELGLSGYWGKYDHNSDIDGFDVDWKISLGPLEIIGEYVLIDLEKGLNKSGVEVPENLYGGYVQANYHFWINSLNQTFLGQNFDNPTFTFVTRLEQVTIDDDGDVDLGDNKEERLTIGLNYRPVSTWVFKLEYQFNSTDREALEHGDKDGYIFSVSASF